METGRKRNSEMVKFILSLAKSSIMVRCWKTSKFLLIVQNQWQIKVLTQHFSSTCDAFTSPLRAISHLLRGSQRATTRVTDFLCEHTVGLPETISSKWRNGVKLHISARPLSRSLITMSCTLSPSHIKAYNNTRSE